MPELAEVRWLRQNLEDHLTGATIQWIQLLHHNLIPQRKTNDTQLLSLALTKRLRNLSFSRVDRVGKYLILCLQPAGSILLHMRFTGWYVPEWAPQVTNWEFLHGMDLYHRPRMVIHTDRGRLLVKDNRCLSRFEIYPDTSSLQLRLQRSLIGPDADTREGLTALWSAMLKRPRRVVRDLLLDQSIASGIGNYLSAELLFRAGIDGRRQVRTLDRQAREHMLRTLVKTVKIAMSTPGYDWWAVFGKTETLDGYPVVREEVSGRGYYFSPHHQS